MSHRLVVPILLASGFLVALLYLISMVQYSRGGLAAPLDDTFIYFQYGRRLAEGHPFEYGPGQELSSGATSMLYPFLLAFGYRIGFTGDGLIVFAYVLAALGLIATAFLAHEALRPRYGTRAGLAAGLLIVLNGWVVWGYLSMMESWLYGTLLVATLYLLTRPLDREAWSWPVATAAAGTLGFARPEGIAPGLAVALLAGVACLRVRARRWPSEGKAPPANPAWALLPVATAGLFFLLNLALFGTVTTNSFAAKSILSAPYLSNFEKAGQIAERFLGAITRLFNNFGPEPLGFVLFSLAVVAVATRLPGEWQRREIGLVSVATALLLGGLAGAAQAPSESDINFRYEVALAPLVAILVVVGLWELASFLRASETSKLVAAGVLVVALAPSTVIWATKFGEHSAEIYLQQREVGLWLRENTPEDALIAINDAGAIAYYSDRRVFDLLGLVTNGQAQAWRAGQGSVYEALERLPADERPDYFAVYPWWFAFLELVPEFETLRQVRLEQPRIVGGDTKAIYEANYSAFGVSERPGDTRGHQVRDQVDVADLTSEGNHGYAATVRQSGIGFPGRQVVQRRLTPNARAIAIDGGRVVSRSERFWLKAKPNESATLRGRFIFQSDSHELSVKVNGERVGTFASELTTGGLWEEREITIPRSVNKTGLLQVELTVETPQQYESYHYWLLQ